MNRGGARVFEGVFVGEVERVAGEASSSSLWSVHKERRVVLRSVYIWQWCTLMISQITWSDMVMLQRVCLLSPEIRTGSHKAGPMSTF